MKTIVLVSTTFDNMADAERIAGLLLERKLIACAQISGPITSLYRWQGVQTSVTEFSLSIKTTTQCTKMVKTVLHQEHPYDLPEVIIQEIDKSNEEYANWVYGEVQP